jgi:glutamyl-tRNA synthetase
MPPDAIKKQVRVRMAPSPTGPLHIGTARTALFNWLFARHNDGVFVLRIEDTDKERSQKKYEDELLEGLSWLGIDWDEGPEKMGYRGAYGPYRQSERTTIYKKYLEKLMAQGDAYYCYCTKEDLDAQRNGMVARGLPPRYNGHCRDLKEPPTGLKPEVIRFKVPEVKVEFKDMIRGKVVFDAALFGDIVIAKDLDTPLYNFAVVVDDALMEITHVIRGEDHIPNTPKQILMQKALGFPEPIYAHLPLILNPDKSKMSKRFTDVALGQYKEKGYLREALINFIAFLGWHPKGDREIFSKDDLIKEFDITRVQKSGAVFNHEKLDWLNKEYLKGMSAAAIADLAAPFFAKEGIHAEKDFLEKVIATEQTRAVTLQDFADMGKFFFTLPDYEASLLIWKDADLKGVKSILNEIQLKFQDIPANAFSRETLSEKVTEVIGIQKRGAVLWPLRVALSGLVSSPDPIEIMETLGKDESLRRIAVAIRKLEQ